MKSQGETIKEHITNLKSLLGATVDCNLAVTEAKSKFTVATLKMLGNEISFKQIKPDIKGLQGLLDL